MTFFKFPFSNLLHKSTPVVAYNESLDAWGCESHMELFARSVQKVEMCTAVCVGNDAWDMPLAKGHHHTLLRVSLRNGPGAEGLEDILLIERVLSTGGAYHSVTPISQTFSTGGTLFHPEVHDRVCVVTEGPSTSLAHDLVVERTLTFDGHALSLADFARILGFVSPTTKAMCDGGDCKYQSRAFAFVVLAAMAPTVPPREVGQGSASKVGHDLEIVDDSVFELSAETFLGQVPWLVRDSSSMQTIQLINTLKHQPRDTTGTRLFH